MSKILCSLGMLNLLVCEICCAGKVGSLNYQLVAELAIHPAEDLNKVGGISGPGIK